MPPQMPLTPLDLIDRRVALGNVPAFTENEMPVGFPVARWNAQSKRYDKYWQHMTGDFWLDTIPNMKDEDGNAVLRYPLKINYIKTAAIKQASMLIGETSDMDVPLIPMRIVPRKLPGNKPPTDARKQLGEELTDFENMVWEENDGDVLQLEAALISQFLGGIYFQLSWHPNDWEIEHGIGINWVLPDFCLPIWNTEHPDQILEMWVAYRLPAAEARMRFNWDPEEKTHADPIYVEHWTVNDITITLDNEPVTAIIEGETFTYDHLENALGMVPFVYIPRKRIGAYYGLSLVDDLEGMSIELNLRLADLGDIMIETAQRKLFARNMPNTNVTTFPLSKGQRVYNIGVTAPGQDPPDIFAVDPPKLPEGIRDYPAMLEKQLGHDASTPPVAFGEDQGSQRSGATLNVRFWSLVAEARSQRTHWRVGMTRLAKMIARLAIIKKQGGITAKHTENMQWRCKFAPYLPKDRETELNEAVMFISQQGLHPAEAMELLGITDDAWNSYKMAQEHFEWKTKVEAEAVAATQALGTEAKDTTTKISKPTVTATTASK